MQEKKRMKALLVFMLVAQLFIDSEARSVKAAAGVAAGTQDAVTCVSHTRFSYNTCNEFANL